MEIHQSASSPATILPREGWHVLHLFFRIDGMQALSAQERTSAQENLLRIREETLAHPETQLLIFSMLGTKADIGFMLISPDLQMLDKFTKQLTHLLKPQFLTPVFSWLSITELSEYITSEVEFVENLKKELQPNSSEFEKKLEEFRSRQKKYSENRLYPHLGNWPVFCFYPMSKRRNPHQNWYALDFETRKKLMAGHARVGRNYVGKVWQLITGSTGLDDGEWGVTLFAHTTSDIKAIVYEMRFDPVSAEYAEFGEFFIGLQMPLNEIFERIGLHTAEPEYVTKLSVNSQRQVTHSSQDCSEVRNSNSGWQGGS